MTRNAGCLVESPGTAPGSDPLITCAFITIVRVAPDKTNIGADARRLKAADDVAQRKTPPGKGRRFLYCCQRFRSLP